MEKIILPDSWNWGDSVAEVVKIARDGMGSNDLRSFLKRASVDFASELKDMRLHPDEVPVHLLAIGSTEGYGPNRNGDGFKEATCREHHHTFVKDARNYKNHKNKDKKTSYGVVKASKYNDRMRRIELLVTFNTTKEAAEHNGGLVAEDWVLKKLTNNDDIPFSMACKVAYDVCASCGNKARNRGEYCDEDSCVGPRGEKRGGCRRHLTKVAYDGFVNHVENPNPGFFDISHLQAQPADRIAYGSVADYMQKAASGEVLGGAALAEAWGMNDGFTLRTGLEVTFDRQIKLAWQLANLERGISHQGGKTAAVGRGLTTTGSLPVEPLQTKQAEALAAMTSLRMLLPLSEFLAVEKSAADIHDVAQRLPGIYSRICEGGAINELVRTNAYPVSNALPSGSVRQWAAKYAADYSLDSVRNRATRSVLRGDDLPVVKQASQLELVCDAERAAWRYALLKLSMLEAMGELPLEALHHAVLQNYVS